MAALDQTPSSDRVRIAFFGLRNAGKSTLVNAFAGQQVAIVSDVAGTTTDPVSKAMEILPLGPCLLTDTAGLDDDQGELGELRVRRTLEVLDAADIAVWVATAGDGATAAREAVWKRRLFDACARRNVTAIEYRRGDSVGSLREQIAAIRPETETPGLLDGLCEVGERVVCVCPIDESAPKGRLILPQVQLLREALDRHLVCTVCQPQELGPVLTAWQDPALVVTDSQMFGAVRQTLGNLRRRNLALTSFSVLFARQKGDLTAYCAGLAAVGSLKDGDRVLIAEACTHHRQCKDIGATQIPKALSALSGRRLEFSFAAGADFPLDPKPALVVHCGGCMLSRRMVLSRLARCAEAGVPVVNYGMLLGRLHGIEVDPQTGLCH